MKKNIYIYILIYRGKYVDIYIYIHIYEYTYLHRYLNFLSGMKSPEHKLGWRDSMNLVYLRRCIENKYAFYIYICLGLHHYSKTLIYT